MVFFATYYYKFPVSTYNARVIIYAYMIDCCLCYDVIDKFCALVK